MAIEDTGTVEGTEQGTDGIPQEGTQLSELETQFQDKPDEGATPGEQMSQKQAGRAPGQSAPGKPTQGQQQSPAWDGSQYALKFRDQQIVPKSREELINLAQRGYGYSQAMEKLNKERASLQQRAAQYQQYDQLDQMLKSNPQLAQKILQAAAEYHGQQGAQPQQGQQSPQPWQAPPELLNRINRIEQEFTKRTQTDEDTALDREIQSLKAKYPSQNWDADNGEGTLERQLLQFAVENKINNLDYAYRAMMWDTQQTNVKADALKQQQQTRVANTRQGVVQSSGQAPAPSPAPAYQAGESYQDLAAKMAAEMRG